MGYVDLSKVTYENNINNFLKITKESISDFAENITSEFEKNVEKKYKKIIYWLSLTHWTPSNNNSRKITLKLLHIIETQKLEDFKEVLYRLLCILFTQLLTRPLIDCMNIDMESVYGYVYETKCGKKEYGAGRAFIDYLKSIYDFVVCSPRFRDYFVTRNITFYIFIGTARGGHISILNELQLIHKMPLETIITYFAFCAKMNKKVLKHYIKMDEKTLKWFEKEKDKTITQLIKCNNKYMYYNVSYAYFRNIDGFTPIKNAILGESVNIIERENINKVTLNKYITINFCLLYLILNNLYNDMKLIKLLLAAGATLSDANYVYNYVINTDHNTKYGLTYSDILFMKFHFISEYLKIIDNRKINYFTPEKLISIQDIKDEFLKKIETFDIFIKILEYV